MLPVPENIKGITHPLVSSICIRKGVGTGNQQEDILVIDTKFPDDEENKDMFDSYLMDLLADLEELKNQAEKKIGKFDRVDIKTH